MTAPKGKVVVTGGAGYIGTHMCVELLDAGFEVVVVDNFANSSPLALNAVEQITQRKITSIEADIGDHDAMAEVFANHEAQAVLHFAGLKAVGESVAQPLRYYQNNVQGTATLLQCMADVGVKRLVFSSSATVYGIPDVMPISEAAPTGPINPYGRTKLMIEQMLEDQCSADPDWAVAALRYFNPVGAHITGEIGEDPADIPNNLMPYIAQVAVGRRGTLGVFGNDYPTPDGTGIRDYIHVVDLAKGHLCALQHVTDAPGFRVHNLGTGRGYSVLEVVAAFERASGTAIPYEITDRRAGDAAVSYADASKAHDDWGWRAEHDIDRMCADVWRWQTKHPQGYTA